MHEITRCRRFAPKLHNKTSKRINHRLKIKAKIDDPDFQKRIDSGEAFAKGDILEADLKINQKWDETVQTYVNKSFVVSRIVRHLRRENNQSKLFD